MKKMLFLAAALLLAANGTALAQANADPTPDMSAMEADPLAPVTVGDIEITDAFARATLPNAPVAGGYLTITNKGTEDDRLVSATSPAGSEPRTSVAPTGTRSRPSAAMSAVRIRMGESSVCAPPASRPSSASAPA